ncbi:MAG TPA: hypothetical protein DCY40_07550, partial [Actinobacteria bacterium]|nr:hypothetical protein [Actinomycetota bacterium]
MPDATTDPRWRIVRAVPINGGERLAVDLVDDSTGGGRQVEISAGELANIGHRGPALYDGRPRPESL